MFDRMAGDVAYIVTEMAPSGLIRDKCSYCGVTVKDGEHVCHGCGSTLINAKEKGGRMMRKRSDRDMSKDLWLSGLQVAIDEFNEFWGGEMDYHTELEVIDGQKSYLVELVDFSEVISEIYYEFPNTYYDTIERMGDAVKKDTGDDYFYFEPNFSMSDLIGRAWPTKGASRHKRSGSFKFAAPSKYDCRRLYRPSDAPTPEIENIMSYWYDCSRSYGDAGSCVLGAGFKFKYRGKWYFMSAQSPWQGSMSWEHFRDEINLMLEEVGAESISYDWGNMD